MLVYIGCKTNLALPVAHPQCIRRSTARRRLSTKRKTLMACDTDSEASDASLLSLWGNLGEAELDSENLWLSTGQLAVVMFG